MYKFSKYNDIYACLKIILSFFAMYENNNNDSIFTNENNN